MKQGKHELISFIRHDIRSGILSRWKRLIPFIFILLGFCIYVVYQCRESMESGLIEDMPTTGDMILFIFRGMREYVPELDPVFLIPVTWLLIQLYIAFVIGGYAYEDLGAYAVSSPLDKEGVLVFRKVHLLCGECCWLLCSCLFDHRDLFSDIWKIFASTYAGYRIYPVRY